MGNKKRLWIRNALFFWQSIFSLDFALLCSANLRVHYYYEWPVKRAANGKEYYYIAKTDIKVLGADAMYLHLDNLFNGEKALGQ